MGLIRHAVLLPHPSAKSLIVRGEFVADVSPRMTSAKIPVDARHPVALGLCYLLLVESVVQFSSSESDGSVGNAASHSRIDHFSDASRDVSRTGASYDSCPYCPLDSSRREISVTVYQSTESLRNAARVQFKASLHLTSERARKDLCASLAGNVREKFIQALSGSTGGCSRVLQPPADALTDAAYPQFLLKLANVAKNDRQSRQSQIILRSRDVALRVMSCLSENLGQLMIEPHLHR